MFYIVILLLFISWIVVTIVDYNIFNKISTGLIAHFISVLTGLVFVFLWHIDIKNVLKFLCDKSVLETNTPLDKKIIISFLLIPILLIFIIILFLTGILSNNIMPVKSIIPSSDVSIAELNNHKGQIRIIFKEPMEKEVRESSLYTTSKEYHSLKLSMDISWLDSKTLLIKFNRDIYNDEEIKIILSGFCSKSGNTFNEKIILNYDM
jgi:hypothetical protein